MQQFQFSLCGFYTKLREIDMWISIEKHVFQLKCHFRPPGVSRYLITTCENGICFEEQLICFHLNIISDIDHSKKSDRGFGDSHPCVVRCLCQGVLVQCRVAHRYPPGSSFPILNCVTYVMHSAGMGVCASNWAFSLNDLHNAISETSGRPYDHSSKSDRGFGDSHPCVVRCLCQGVLVQCRVVRLTGTHRGVPFRL